MGHLSCFSLKLGIFPRPVRVSRSELTKKRVVGVERVGERRKRNGVDGYPFRSFSLLLPAEISKVAQVDPPESVSMGSSDSETGRMENNITMASGWNRR